MAIGQCGSVLGTHLFPATEGPTYVKGFAVSCALEFLAALSAFVLTVSVSCARLQTYVRCSSVFALQISYRLDNRQRDKKHGKVENPDAPVETRELADKVSLSGQICGVPI